jgi:hypothetical protein
LFLLLTGGRFPSRNSQYFPITNHRLVVELAASKSEFLLAPLLWQRSWYIFQGFHLVMGYQFWLILLFGLRSIGKSCLLLSFAIEFLTITLLTRRLRLEELFPLAFVLLSSDLIKLLFMPLSPLPFLIPKTNYANGFLLVFLVISPIQLH